ncbi:MAG TPA: thioredoxin domain-containing protein [Mycobacterium sp.]|nr:thioredoxin domain-containing protein [Mycobacterium sp.]
MRISRAVMVLSISLLIAAVGCTRQVSGTAQPDPNKAPLGVSKDSYGIVAGFDNAPVKIEIYTEPQCNHCADLQADFGDQLAYYIAVGQLEVTYRPMIFMDDKTYGYSGQVSNALFLATEAAGSPEVKATGTQFQRFVQNVWAHQRPGGAPPSGDELQVFATKAGVPEPVAKNIKSGKSAVNVKDMDDTNFEFLYEIESSSMGTPTVYDLTKDEKIDIYDNDWLNKLMQS